MTAMEIFNGLIKKSYIKTLIKRFNTILDMNYNSRCVELSSKLATELIIKAINEWENTDNDEEMYAVYKIILNKFKEGAIIEREARCSAYAQA